jgi:hypothetical protein
MKYIFLTAIGFLSQAGPAYAQVYWHPVNQQMACMQQRIAWQQQQIAWRQQQQQIAWRQQRQVFDMAEYNRQQALMRHQQAIAINEYNSLPARMERQRQADNAARARAIERVILENSARVWLNEENARKARAGEDLVKALIILRR